MERPNLDIIKRGASHEVEELCEYIEFLEERRCQHGFVRCEVCGIGVVGEEELILKERRAKILMEAVFVVFPEASSCGGSVNDGTRREFAKEIQNRLLALVGFELDPMLIRIVDKVFGWDAAELAVIHRWLFDE